MRGERDSYADVFFRWFLYKASLVLLLTTLRAVPVSLLASSVPFCACVCVCVPVCKHVCVCVCVSLAHTLTGGEIPSPRAFLKFHTLTSATPIQYSCPTFIKFKRLRYTLPFNDRYNEKHSQYGACVRGLIYSACDL